LGSYPERVLIFGKPASAVSVRRLLDAPPCAAVPVRVVQSAEFDDPVNGTG